MSIPLQLKGCSIEGDSTIKSFRIRLSRLYNSRREFGMFILSGFTYRIDSGTSHEGDIKIYISHKPVFNNDPFYQDDPLPPTTILDDNEIYSHSIFPGQAVSGRRQSFYISLMNSDKIIFYDNYAYISLLSKNYDIYDTKLEITHLYLKPVSFMK